MDEKITTTAHHALIDNGVDRVEADIDLVDFVSNENKGKTTNGHWGATANGWAQTSVIRKK